MSSEQKTILHKEYLEVIATGEFNLEDAIDYMPSVMHACRRNHLSKVIIDYRKLYGEIPVIEKIVFAQETIETYKYHLASRGKELKFAFAGNAAQVMSSYKPGLEMAQKKGIQAIVTDDIHEALEWLGVKNI